MLKKYICYRPKCMCKSIFLYNSFKYAKIPCVYIYILPSPYLVSPMQDDNCRGFLQE